MNENGRESVARRGFMPGKAPIAGFLAAMLVLSTLSGCAGLRQSMAEAPGRSAALCAGGGALGGAAVGALVDQGNALRGALIGALAGGATCFAMAKFSSTPVKDYQQTQHETGYQPTQGTVVRVDSFKGDPATVSPGQTLTFSGEYYVMTPDPHADLLAALRTLRQEFDLAIDALDQALKRGFDNYESLRRDADLEGLRQQPEFRRLLERHKISL